MPSVDLMDHQVDISVAPAPFDAAVVSFVAPSVLMISACR